MLSRTVLLLVYLWGFRPFVTYKIDLNNLQNQSHINLYNKVIPIIARTRFNRTNSITISVDVGTIDTWYAFNDFADLLFKELGHLKVQIESFAIHHPDVWDKFNVIFVDSESSFRRRNPGDKTKNQDYSEYYLVIYQPSKFENLLKDTEGIFAYCWGYYIMDVTIALEDTNGNVRIYTYFPFNQKKCFSTTAVEVTGSSFAEIFPPKIANLHRCELIGALWWNPPYISWRNSSNSFDRFIGLEGQMLNELSNNMNFTVKIETPQNDERRGLIFRNGTVTGAIKMLQTKEVHFSLGCFRHTQERATILTASYSFYQTLQVFFSRAHGQPWTAFEIMTYPFDFYIWSIMLSIITTTIVLSVFLEKYQPKTLKFIFGTGNSGNVFNIISAWLGYPVIPEPSRNFARFILTLWMFTALILRNAYQGLLYNFLSSNLAKLPPDTAMQLAQQNYVVVVSSSSNDTLSQLPIVKDGLLPLVVMKINEFETYPILENSVEKVASSLPRDFVSFYVKETRKYGVFHVLKEAIFTHQICVYFSKHSFFTDRFDEILLNFRSFGLIDFWASKSLADDLIESGHSEPRTEISLTMNQLDGAFLLLAICLGTSLLVFFVELLSMKSAFVKKLFE